MNEQEKEEFWQDLGRPTDKVNQCAFTVFVDAEGRIQTDAIDAGTTIGRKATTYDIYQSCKEIVSDIESHLLADRVAKLILDKLQPKTAAEEIKEKIINALNDRKQEAPLD